MDVRSSCGIVVSLFDERLPLKIGDAASLPSIRRDWSMGSRAADEGGVWVCIGIVILCAISSEPGVARRIDGLGAVEEAYGNMSDST